MKGRAERRAGGPHTRTDEALHPSFERLLKSMTQMLDMLRPRLKIVSTAEAVRAIRFAARQRG